MTPITNNNISILIVDDLQENLLSLEAVLGELKQPLFFANSAKEALRLILKHDFAVILLDVHMPDIDGFETARLIRSREKSSYTPIIFLSAFTKDEVNVNQGYSMGAVDFIFKPINPIILRSKVQVFIDLFTKSTLAINLQNELQNRSRAEQYARKQQHQLKLAELDRISTIEEMTSTFAHELNQPLTVISNYVNGCINRLNANNFEKEELVAILQRIGQQTERAGSILHRIKNFSQKSAVYYEAVVINDLIANIILILKEMLQELGIELTLKLSKKTMCQIVLDKVQIEQVLFNLIRNSMEALQHYPKPKKIITIETTLKTKHGIIIKVKDNGPGINSDYFVKLFDLYFTTKKEGMGVGLSVCRTIIEAHGGNIIAKNNRSGGACFQFNLPIMEETHVLAKK